MQVIINNTLIDIKEKMNTMNKLIKPAGWVAPSHADNVGLLSKVQK
jgi:hypothetical protein